MICVKEKRRQTSNPEGFVFEQSVLRHQPAVKQITSTPTPIPQVNINPRVSSHTSRTSPFQKPAAPEALAPDSPKPLPSAGLAFQQFVKIKEHGETLYLLWGTHGGDGRWTENWGRSLPVFSRCASACNPVSPIAQVLFHRYFLHQYDLIDQQSTVSNSPCKCSLSLNVKVGLKVPRSWPVFACWQLILVMGLSGAS